MAFTTSTREVAASTAKRRWDRLRKDLVAVADGGGVAQRHPFDEASKRADALFATACDPETPDVEAVEALGSAAGTIGAMALYFVPRSAVVSVQTLAGELDWLHRSLAVESPAARPVT